LESVNADAIIAHGGYLFTTQLEKKEEKLDRADGQEKEREKKPLRRTNSDGMSLFEKLLSTPSHLSSSWPPHLSTSLAEVVIPQDSQKTESIYISLLHLICVCT
jgi:hypothetical protein